jgi:hypothetical protein
LECARRGERFWFLIDTSGTTHELRAYHRISRFVFCYERIAELIECAAFNFCARPTHQVQIKM